VSPDELRKRIETALRARHVGEVVRVEVREHDAAQWRASAYVGEPVGDDIHARPRDGEPDALAALAVAVGLDADGTDPRSEARALLDGVRAALGPTCADATHEALPGLVREVVQCDGATHERCDEQRDEIAALRGEVEHLEGRRGALLAEVDRLRADAARARAAYATDLDGLRAEVRRADDERAAWRDLRDAVRAYLDAEKRQLTHAARTRLAALVGGDATVRRDLPAEAVVSCPACGYGVTADLDDDGAYITRRHSRREPARVGAGEIVWCDGGLVRGAS